MSDEMVDERDETTSSAPQEADDEAAANKPAPDRTVEVTPPPGATWPESIPEKAAEPDGRSDVSEPPWPGRTVVPAPTPPPAESRKEGQPMPPGAAASAGEDSLTAKGAGEWSPTPTSRDTPPAGTPEPSPGAGVAGFQPAETTVRLDIAQVDELMRLRAQQDQALRKRFQREVVVMFTDVAGSTAYYERYGDLAGRQKMLTHNALLFPVIRAHGGTIVKTIGDSIMACFDAAVPALAAAAEMQHTLAEFNTSVPTSDDAINVRIGLNAGEAILERGDLHGDVVNVAARVEARARAGEVLVADVVAQQAPDAPLVSVGPATMKGKREPLLLHRLKWKEETTGAHDQIRWPELPEAFRARFELRGTIGRGPLGVVYEARDVRRDTLVAIKLLYGFSTAAPEARPYFRETMWSNVQLHHPNIARVLEFSASPDSRAYVVSERVDGINLAELLARTGCPTMPELARIGHQVASALEHAHAAGCVHGDVKPENVLIDQDDDVKLTDLGLVGLWTDRVAAEPMSSPAFIAPQALSGHSTDPRGDVYSLGALLYYLAVGRGPVDGHDATVASLRAVVSGRTRPLSQVSSNLPTELVAIVDKAMSAMPGKRFQTMADLKARLATFRDQLEAAESDATATAIVDTARTNLPAFASHRRRRWLWLALAPVLLATAIWVTLRSCTSGTPPPPPAATIDRW